jgi:hypothetical protein
MGNLSTSQNPHFRIRAVHLTVAVWFVLSFLLFGRIQSGATEEDLLAQKCTEVLPTRLKIVRAEGTSNSKRGSADKSKEISKVYLDGKFLGDLNDGVSTLKISGEEPPDVLPDATSRYRITLLKNGWVLLSGGYKPEAKDQPLNLSSAIYFWNPANRKLENNQHLQTARAMHDVTTLTNGKILVTGGISNEGHYLTQVEIIDPTTRSVTSGGNLLEARLSPSILKLKDGRVLLAGGQIDLDKSGGMESQTAEIYDPVKKTSRLCGDLRYCRQGDTLLQISERSFLLIGGYNSQSEPNSRHLPAEILTLPK